MMKPVRTVLTLGVIVGLAVAFTGCSSSSSSSASATASPAPTASAAAIARSSSALIGGDRYGGPSYLGKPNLAATAALVKAGGGAAKFSTAKAFTSMLGAKMTKIEIAKLTKQYGKAKIKQYFTTSNFAIEDALKIAAKAGITLPTPAPLKGKSLAMGLVNLGTTSNGTFWTGWMLDHAVSHKIHDHVMNNIDAKYGEKADANYHRISNQAFYDVAQALGKTKVKLASFH
ncbi:MAG: hypothetical protein ACYDA5_11755 [Vulcanimicrobiaceae bacterium]